MVEKKEPEVWGGWEGIDIRKPMVRSELKKLGKDINPRWKKLLSNPRVLKKSEIVSQEREGVSGEEVMPGRGVDTEKLGLRTFIAFFQNFAGGGNSWNHGHMNEAVFYILKGRGYEIHDGEKYPWEAGDVVIVPNAAVHCHLNADPVEGAQALVLNPKQVFLNLNLIAQRIVQFHDEVERKD